MCNGKLEKKFDFLSTCEGESPDHHFKFQVEQKIWHTRTNMLMLALFFLFAPPHPDGPGTEEGKKEKDGSIKLAYTMGPVHLRTRCLESLAPS